MTYLVVAAAAALLTLVLIFIAGTSVLAACAFGGLGFVALLAWFVTAA
jgi:hypothetical protein